MKPVSEVTNEDCMKMMKRYPDNFFELAIVDPPYGISWHKMGFENTKHLSEKYDIDWDIVPNEEYWEELKRISQKQIICGINYFVKHFDFFTPIVWDKKNGDSIMGDGELLGATWKTKFRIFHHAYHGKYNPDPVRIHPTQKPVALYEWLMKSYAKKSDKILDTHLGSGSSRIAAFKLEFDFYGCEIDKDYFEESEKRFKREISVVNHDNKYF